MLREKMHKKILKKRGIELLIIGLFVVIFFSTAAAKPKESHPVIDVKIQSAAIMQDEEVPAFSVDFSSKDTKAVLDEKSKYTVGDLLAELQSGSGYTLKSDADGKVDGEFSVRLEFSEDIEKKINSAWIGKVEVKTAEGTLTVKNKYGEWEENKFKKIDGTYAADELVISQGKVYYINADGEKTGKGFQEFAGAKYYFEEDGSAKTGWYKDGNDKYYFGEDGRMNIGFLTLGEDSYCFDADGKMLTGKQQIGTLKCVFDKNGKLESKEYEIDPTKPMIALTFDDGPGPRTMELLNVLEENGARATFFMVGTNIPKYPDTVKRMDELGCELANHSQDHPNLTKLDAAGIQYQVQSVSDAVKQLVGHGTELLRPPYGAINDNVKANAGLPLVLWSIDTIDWKVKDKAQTVANIWGAEAKGSLDGDVILLHDIHDWSVDAAIEVIPQLVAKGYQLVTVSEMAEARGVKMEAGGKYADFYKE